jgi:hypothetical protein
MLDGRVSQAVLDLLSDPAWDASRNRHIGQRNIYVMSAAEAAAKPTLPIAVGRFSAVSRRSRSNASVRTFSGRREGDALLHHVLGLDPSIGGRGRGVVGPPRAH